MNLFLRILKPKKSKRLKDRLNRIEKMEVGPKRTLTLKKEKGIPSYYPLGDHRTTRP